MSCIVPTLCVSLRCSEIDVPRDEFNVKKVKVKVTLQQARKAQKWSRSIDLLFL